MPDQIHLTVASVIERDGNYLTVAEYSGGKLVYNQPAGHVESGEKLADAMVRETLEETGWSVEATALISLNTFLAPNGVTYYRVCFAARAVSFDPGYIVDDDIDHSLWLSYEQLLDRRAAMRSPLVLAAVEDYRAGKLQPLDMLQE